MGLDFLLKGFRVGTSCLNNLNFEPDLDWVSKNEPNPDSKSFKTQPNPYNLGWVGLNSRVSKLSVHP